MTWSELFKYSPKIIRKALGEYDKEYDKLFEVKKKKK